MEDALVPYELFIIKLSNQVLILVLMEDALVPLVDSLYKAKLPRVLILVLMEDALVHH